MSQESKNPFPTKIIQIEVPIGDALCYLQAAIKAGQANLEQSIEFMELAGNSGASIPMSMANQALEALQETLTFARQQAFIEMQQAHNPKGFSAAVAPTIESDEDEDDGSNPLRGRQ